MNPMDMIKGMIGKMSPEQIVMNMVGKNINPMYSNLIKMAQNGDKDGVENFARNMFKQQGRDFDKEYNDFMNNFQ